MPKLVIFRGDAVENEIRLAGSTIRIGRHNRNDVVLDDSANGVSRFHAEIRAEGGGYSIVDLNSRNGVWINGRRIKEKAPLGLGVPATLGAYELTLEDDVSTGEFDDEAALLNQPTIVNSGAVEPRDGSSRSGTRSPRAAASSPPQARQRQLLLWSGATVAVVVLCAVTFAVVRYRTRPAPVVAVVTPPPVVPIPEPQTPPTPPVDTKKAQIDQHLVDARAQMDATDYLGAVRDHLQPVLDLDPENAQALAMKQEAETAAAPSPNPTPKVKTPPKEPTEVETAGIPRRPNEIYADYTTRVTRIKVNFAEGSRLLENKEYLAAINRFRQVERDQPKYPGVDSAIAEAISRQQKDTEQALDNGQRNEAINKLHDALGWYHRALEIDPASTAARDKIAALTERSTKMGMEAFANAEVYRKRGDSAKAVQYYKQAAELLPPGHEKLREAQRYLETLKP